LFAGTRPGVAADTLETSRTDMQIDNITPINDFFISTFSFENEKTVIVLQFTAEDRKCQI
jgi:hypothetical protein